MIYWFSLSAHVMIFMAALIGVVVAVPAGLASGFIAGRQGRPLWYGAIAALYSALALLPWVYFICKQLGYSQAGATRLLVRASYFALYASWFLGPVTFGIILLENVCEGCSAYEGSFIAEFRPLFIALVGLNLIMAVGTLVWIGNTRDEEPYLLRPVYVLPFALTILWGAIMMAAFFNAA